ncbi:hypothetical protein GCM10009750_06770 [Agromyces salentinus]|uniref:SGNH hydrolase-type esterase domain-containing protein n=1 Tax=Agromyces salentinus TaxID=269421 RepID=A0ABN2MHV3_9MICO
MPRAEAEVDGRGCRDEGGCRTRSGCPDEGPPARNAGGVGEPARGRCGIRSVHACRVRPTAHTRAATALGAAATGADVEWAPVEFGAHRVGGVPPAYLGSDPANPETFLHPTPDGYLVYRDAVLAAIG